MLQKKISMPIVVILAMFSGVLSSRARTLAPTADEMAEARRFFAAKFTAPQSAAPQKAGLIVAVNNGPIQLNSRNKKPMKLGDKEFTRGIHAHATSKIIVQLPGFGKKFSAIIGLDNNEQTSVGQGSVVFSINVGGHNVLKSDVFKVATPAKSIEVDLQGAKEFALEVGDAGDGIGWDQADWADARIELADGETIWIGDLPILDVQDGLFSADPPFSFTYNGIPSSEFLGIWKINRTSKKLDDSRTVHTVTYSDPAGGLVVRCEAVEYADFPTVEWKLFFKNTGKTDTPIIENIQSLDIRWQRGPGEYLLHHNIGSPADGTDYTPLESVLGGNSTKRLGASGGRSTNTNMSYFNLERSKDDGLIVVVGWPGQWAAEFIRDADTGLRIRAGQELTHFKLLPNEEVRTPMSVLQFWKGGDWIRSQNIWRRWMIAHNMPRPGGKLPQPMLLAYLGGAYEEMYKSNEEIHFQWFNRYLEEKIPLDYWWMDAGWYPCDPVGWPKVGTWEVDKKRFPHGLKAITDYVHSKGMKTLLWFEPERVAEGSWLADNHPEWVLGGKQGGLLNFGNPDVLKWITDRVDKVLTEQGIDLYRQDFNMDPLSYWRKADDAPDRQGITEIRHVTNLLAYWDELRRRHPNMLIDECASGGRRNDLEMMRRAVPMWRSDKTMEPIGQTSMTYGLSMWIPYFGTGTVAWADAAYFVTGKTPIESYGFWCSACPSLNLLFDVREKGLDYDKIRHLTAQWREVMPYFYGDFYPLTKDIPQNDVWIAWQFDRPEKDDGIVQAFRRKDSIYESAHLKLRGLDPKSKYQITQLDKTEKAEISGKELMTKGLLVTMSECPDAAVIQYHRVP